MVKDGLIIKLAAVGGGLLIVAWLANRTATAIGSGYDSVGNAISSAGSAIYSGVSGAADFVGQQVTTTLNPASDQNFIYRGVNGIGSGITGDRDWSLGSWLYDVTHPTPAPKPITSGGGGQFNGHGATGGWGTPTRYDVPDYGIYF